MSRVLDTAGGTGRHAGQTVARLGPPLAEAKAALILLHGRGGHADGMLDLGRLLCGPDFLCVAPHAFGHVWYPRRFIEPVAHNEPDLSSALSVVASLVRNLLEGGLAPERIGLAGFSQGACLALEYVRRQGGVGCVLGFSGGLIGETAGRPGPATLLSGVPVLLGCSERDPHIPLARVNETATLLAQMGAEVTIRISPGATHEVTEDEVVEGRRILAEMTGR